MLFFLTRQTDCQPATLVPMLAFLLRDIPTKLVASVVRNVNTGRYITQIYYATSTRGTGDK